MKKKSDRQEDVDAGGSTHVETSFSATMKVGDRHGPNAKRGLGPESNHSLMTTMGLEEQNQQA